MRGGNGECECFCATVDAEEIYRCRTNNPAADFLLVCSGDQVIYIRSAVVGFSPTVNSNTSDWRCPRLEKTCTRSVTNHSAIMNCHRERVCWIPQGFFYYILPDKLCEEHQHGNFIKIKYDCINPGKRTCCLMDIFCFQLIIIIIIII